MKSMRKNRVGAFPVNFLFHHRQPRRPRLRRRRRLGAPRAAVPVRSDRGGGGGAAGARRGHLHGRPQVPRAAAYGELPEPSRPAGHQIGQRARPRQRRLAPFEHLDEALLAGSVHEGLCFGGRRRTAARDQATQPGAEPPEARVQPADGGERPVGVHGVAAVSPVPVAVAASALGKTAKSVPTPGLPPAPLSAELVRSRRLATLWRRRYGGAHTTIDQ